MKRARFDSSQVSPPSDSGDHQPKISRKIRACQACQNRKIKCHLEPGQEQCARCSRLGLRCIVNKSLQTLLDGENEWKRNIETQMQILQAALSDVQRTLNMPRPLPTQLPNLEGNDSVTPGGGERPVSSAAQRQSHANDMAPVRPTGMTRENSVEAGGQEGDDDQAMVSAPMASLFELTKLRNVRSHPWARIHRTPSQTLKADFIAQGKFDLLEAERLFARFRETLNAYLWGGIALAHDTLDEVRASSSLLTAAILAVTALHAQDDGRAFDVCYSIFLELVTQAVFDRHQVLDDVRGLCIGAFYLSDLSWKLSGLAVRIATELNLHQFSPDPHIADYPAKGVILHYHFARVQLFSICLRGLRPTEQYTMSDERREFINLAISSAFGALELILDDPDMRPAVIGVPLYLLTTIAYACLFLMKAQTQWKSANLNIRYENVATVMEGIVALLEETSPCVRHVAHYLGRGLSGMLKKFQQRNMMERQQQRQQNGQPVPLAHVDGVGWPDWNDWMFGAVNVPSQFPMDTEQQHGLSLLDALSSQMPD
ncbi:hypothetical protein E4U43_003650 [Claviceps pusilla]|uniref:Zn(2)-C6 fungal-type domain-containing protein n=1 Tax=Claviceps pusilla TaxID=123648 RepID=A0A9P7NFT9_9HYPO|nr:hypothetical protein E4U43_003650 [Claviceps pusilla]